MLADAQPTIDMLTLSVRYGLSFKDKVTWDLHCERLNGKFDRLCRIITNDLGYSLQSLRNGRIYITKYEIYLSSPNAR